MEETSRKQSQQLLTTLQAIKNIYKELQKNPISLFKYFLPLIRTLLTLDSITKDPKLFKLSLPFYQLKNLHDMLENSNGCCLQSLVRRHIIKRRVSRVASNIEAGIQAWIDQEMVQSLVTVMEESGNEEAKVEILKDFETRVSQGFDKEFQELVLKAKAFLVLEECLCFGACSKLVKEKVALAMSALVRFNRHVFGGWVFMGPTVPALVHMGSHRAIQVLCNFVELIKIPFVDEMKSSGVIEKIVRLLSSDDFLIQKAALDCILEIGYFGRKEVIEDMLQQGLIEKLVELQRSEAELKKELGNENRDMSNCSYSNFVTMFVAKLEKGEGLEQNERRELKWEILRRVKEVCVSEAEALSIIEDSLWNSLP